MTLTQREAQNSKPSLCFSRKRCTMKTQIASGFLRKWKQKNTGLFYVMPWIIGFLLFTLYPFISSFFNSFTNNLGGNASKFIGFKNYIDIFTVDFDFVTSSRVTLLFVLIAVPMKLCFALFIAMLLNMHVRGSELYRTIFYTPSVLGGGIAVSIVWRMLFLKNGLINRFLSSIGLSSVGWLSDPNIALFTISLLTVWQFGSSMVIFLAGLRQIPHDLYEAATVDGATKSRMFFVITLPMLTPVILFNLIMQMINAFQEFTSAFIITDGGPVKSTYLYAYKMYVEGFRNFRLGYASALSWILFVVIIFFTLVIFKISDRFVFYESEAGN